MRNISWFLCSGLLLLTGILAHAQPAIKFIENRNQWPAEVDFVAQVPGGRMVLAPSSFRYFFLDHRMLDALHHGSHEPDGASTAETDIRGHAVFVDFPGANAGAKAHGLGRLPEYHNYYVGTDPTHWASRAHAYTGVIYESVFAGVDLKVYSYGQHVKYDFIVAPGGDPSRINAVYRGADNLFLENGDLIIRTTLGDVIEKEPVAWQVVNGEKVNVPCAFQLRGDTVSYYFPEGFDECQELVVDPLLIFSTFSGSTADNWGSTATPGEHGRLYSAGVTRDAEGGKFPATPGAYQVNSGGLYDIGILKYDSLGSALLFATHLGGESNESPHSLVVNSANDLLLLATTSSENFPTTDGAFDRTFNAGVSLIDVIGYPYTAGCDIAIARFSADGTALLASSFVGGSANDGLNPPGGILTRNYGDQLRGDIITDDANNIYVSSVTSSEDFPVTASFGLAYNGGSTDAIVFKMDPDLAGITWAAFVGGSGTDAAHSIKIGGDGSVFVAGGTSSANFSTTTESYGTIYRGNVDGWIAEIASDGSSILHATLTGTSDYDQIYFLDLNREEEVYVYGQTTGSFPVTPGVYNNPNSGQFIQKFTHELDSLIFSTVFGAGRGIPDISPTAFLVNDCNNLFMSGWGGRVNSETGYWASSTIGMTTTPDALQSTTRGSDFYFLVLKDDAKERLYATFFGGTQSSTHVDGGTSRFDKSGIVYHSVCSGCRFFNTTNAPTSDFPTTNGAWSQVNRSANCNNAAFKLDLSTLKARLRTNSGNRDAPGLQVVCIPDAVIGFENRSTGGTEYLWDFGDGTSEVRMDTAFLVHEYEDAGQYVVTLSAVDVGTCQVIDIVSTKVTVNESESFVQDDDEMCFGDSYQLQSSGGIQYQWTSADGAFSSANPTPIISPDDTTTYYVVIREASGCIRKDTVAINVVPGIKAEFEWTKLPACITRPRITVRNITDSLTSRDAFFFDFGDGTTSDMDETEHTFERDGVYNIRIVTQREFCVYEQAVAIPVFEMFIPNVITPGVPDHNDVLTIRYGQVDGITPADYGYRVSLSIYNRWGELVYESDDYQYNWNGYGLSSGTYYYEVTIEGHATCRSWLRLVK